MEVLKKVDNSKTVLAVMVLLMVMTAVYMSFVIKTVPRTVESSKIGPFPELMVDIIAFHQGDTAEQKARSVLDREGVNAELKRLVPYEGLALKRSAVQYDLLATSLTKLAERDLLQLKLRHPEGTVFTISMYPIAKRHFPKTRSFVHKNSWLFQYGKDLANADNLPPTARLPVLEQAGLNTIATNYGNDYYILLTSEAPAQDMAKWLFEATTIFSPKK